MWSYERRNLKIFVRSVVYHDRRILLEKKSCRKNKKDVDGKGKKHTLWCQVATTIQGRGGGDYMLLV